MVRHVRERGKRYSHTRAKQPRDPHTTRGPRGHLLVTYNTLQYCCGYSCSEPRTPMYQVGPIAYCIVTYRLTYTYRMDDTTV